MHYFETQPSAELAEFVECFWTLEGDGNTPPVEPERLLPDGCVELILNFGERFREHKDNGKREYQPVNMIVGQMTRPILISPTGRIELLGIRFHPGGAFAFFRTPLHEFTNRVVDLGALCSKFEYDLAASAGDSPSNKTRIPIVERLLAARARELRSEPSLVGLTSMIVRRGGQISVDRLAREAGISSRQLERKFLREVGIGPKLLCRILRFQQIFGAVNRNDAGWASVAADCGYYDQAHLIRDFSQFAGQSPVQLFNSPSTLTESFSRKDRMSDFSNNLF
jgi:AraC-like DNA-binding protein